MKFEKQFPSLKNKCVISMDAEIGSRNLKMISGAPPQDKALKNIAGFIFTGNGLYKLEDIRKHCLDKKKVLKLINRNIEYSKTMGNPVIVNRLKELKKELEENQ